MISRVRGLFARYADRHLSVTGKGAMLPSIDGRPLGKVNRTLVHGNRIHFQGWTTADQIILSWDGGQIVQRPHLQRQDITSSHEVDAPIGFAVEAPLHLGPFRLTLRQGKTEHNVSLSPPSDARMAVGRLRLAGRFLWSLTVASPSILRWKLSGDTAHRARVKSILALDSIPAACPMRSDPFAEGYLMPSGVMENSITIILPVYNAFDLLPEVLDRVERHTDLDWHLIIIEDASPDPSVRPFLQEWKSSRSDRVTLVENDVNLGFIKSVNKGLTLALGRGDHVVLLNSDALVPTAWASRLIAPICRQDNVASVTPMSNDAEIFSVPAICARANLGPGEADAIDAIARRFHQDVDLCDAPTGVGFCMAMNIDYLRKLPQLDTSFGRGYGEEVDWCQKARTLEGRHLGLPGLFVEHKGGESFGSKEKLALVQKNNELVAQRYPYYDREVQEFIQTDPLVTTRVALAIAFVAVRSKAAVPVYLAHSLGGGAESYLQDRISRALEEGQSAIVIRVGGQERFQIEVRTPEGETTGTTNDLAFVQRLLAVLPERHIIYSCGVGDPDPVELPAILLQLARTTNGRTDQIEVLVHDFFPVSPSYCLLDSDGTYRGPVLADRLDRAHSTRRPDKAQVSLPDWQAAWRSLLDAADSVIVFSENSRSHMLASYPHLEAKLRTVPHILSEQVPILPSRAQSPVVIGVLGNIGRQKGAGIVQKLAELSNRRRDFRIVLVGNIDPTFGLPATTPVHGNYRIADLPAIASRYEISCWLIPSIWPETFSYTTHECLGTGLPVFAFDIGAQGDAVRLAENGFPVAFDPKADLAQSILNRVLNRE